jgi:uncharacterized protein YaiI (UPF0178 family)
MAQSYIVDDSRVFEAELKVVEKGKVVINTNGNGYKSDNVSRDVNDRVLHITVQAKTAALLRQKVIAILQTLDMPEGAESDY